MEKCLRQDIGVSLANFTFLEETAYILIMGDDTISCWRFSLPVRTRLLLKSEKPTEKRNRKTRYINRRWRCWWSFCGRNYWLRSQGWRITILRVARPNRWNEHDIVHGKRYALRKCQDLMANLRVVR